MKRLLPFGAALAAALALAACGGGSSDSSDSSNASADSGGGSRTVSVKSVNGIGDVLVDPGGKALYTSDVEADGKVRCTGGCTSFWVPLTVDSGTPTAADGAGKLGVVERPDGAKQVTAGGKPLYTFSEDSAGKVTGNGFSDDFEGRHFTWTAAMAGGKAADASKDSDGSKDSDSGPGYGDGY
jgi:predicted lipoprotein with Yx(FWY)xxD motif